MNVLKACGRRKRPWLSGSTSDSEDTGGESDEIRQPCLERQATNGRVTTASGRRRRRRRIHRILDRDGLEYQSHGKFKVRHRRESRSIFAFDFYHVALHMPFWGLFIIFTSVYVLCFMFFAAFWLQISEECNIGVTTFREAFYLSLETQMTIGYGVPDPNFNNCVQVGYVLVAQLVVGLMLDATIIGIVFQHVSSAYTRASTVIFSDVACLQEIDGCVHLIFRVAEMHRHPLLQAVMQVYCVQHHRDSTQPRGRRVEVTTVALQEPDTDVHNGVIFLGLPATVVHKVDHSSPLAPDVPPGTEGHPSAAEVKRYLLESPYLEILVLLSGTEDATASSIEARHSYTLDDMYWNRAFASCVSIDSEGFHTVDFRAIHHTVALQPTKPEANLRHLHSQPRMFPATVDFDTESECDEDENDA
eukprot:TRINITY_DN22329_c0_g1_i1.p2 TRINITY_DN22329_c0_g1~~TRINITY_DN22329_c0_g1_i1.p2  ORF type:complete len:417 (+),score=77.24 TRINITY_DN22329_c0_g1_i1:116-1366(+)